MESSDYKTKKFKFDFSSKTEEIFIKGEVSYQGNSMTINAFFNRKEKNGEIFSEAWNNRQSMLMPNADVKRSGAKMLYSAGLAEMMKAFCAWTDKKRNPTGTDDIINGFRDTLLDSLFGAAPEPTSATTTPVKKEKKENGGDENVEKVKKPAPVTPPSTHHSSVPVTPATPKKKTEEKTKKEKKVDGDDDESDDDSPSKKQKEKKVSSSPSEPVKKVLKEKSNGGGHVEKAKKDPSSSKPVIVTQPTKKSS